jgi:hypothetical protein
MNTAAMHTWRNARKTRAFTLTELLLASAAGIVILGGLLAGTVFIQRNISATSLYATGINDQNRLMDYVARDLRRALRVSLLASGTETALKTFAPIAITESNVLAITVPDYYASNVPNNASMAPFKVTRYPRGTLNVGPQFNGYPNPLLNGCVPWSEALTGGSNPSARYAPVAAGSGEIQVRYFRGARSATDATPCFFRGEYPPGSATASLLEEIAERVIDPISSTRLLLSGRANGTVFRLQSGFIPRFKRLNPSGLGTEQFVEVTLRNVRRD